MMPVYMDTSSTPEITRKLILASKPFHVVCKLFGLMPFTVDMRTASLRRCRSDSVILTLACSAQLVSGIAYLYLLSASVHMFSTVDIITLMGNVIHTVLSLVPVISDAFFNQKKYENLLQLITLCDGILTAYIKKENSNDGTFIKLQLLLLLFYFCVMVIGWLTMHVEQFSRVGGIFAMYCYTTILVTVLQFLNLQLVIKQRLSYLNICILKILDNLHATSCGQEHRVKRVVLGIDLRVSHRGAPCMSEQVRSLRRVYMGLCELSVVVSSIQASFLILHFVAMSVSSVIMLYFSFTDALLLGIDLKSMKWQNRVGVLFHLCSISLLVVPAHCVEAEAGRTRGLCWRLLVEGRRVGGAAHRELRLLALQATSGRPQASLAGVLTLRLGLVATFISVLTTYTTLMVTFWPSGNSSQNQT